MRDNPVDLATGANEGIDLQIVKDHAAISKAESIPVSEAVFPQPAGESGG